MNSTFMGLEISRRGLVSHQQALNVTGHNISNADNKEYSRQRVVITSADPLYVPGLSAGENPGSIGQGSVVSVVERVRDSFIDDRIVTEKNEMGYWEARNNYIYQIEGIYNEPSDSSIRTKNDQLWVAWQELSKYPEQRSTREVVKEKAVSLSNEINNVYRQLDELQQNSNREIALRVDTINTYARDIRDLNVRIVKAEAVGDQPNDLKDRRDALVERLSQLVNVSVSRSDKDETIIYVGSENLVQGEVMHEMKTKLNPDNKGFYDVVWAKSEKPVYYSSGEMKALVDIRDVVLRENINNINGLALNITDLTNEVHRDGFGKNGVTNVNFFREIQLSDKVDGSYDLNSDGMDDVTALFKVAGTTALDSSAAVGIAGTLTFALNDESDGRVQIDYNRTDTVNSIMKKINDSKIGVSAYLDHNGHFALKATAAKDNDKKNFMLRYMEDSGEFLVGMTGILQRSGRDGAFDYREIGALRQLAPDREHLTLTPRTNPASYIAVSKDIQLDVDSIAASKGEDIDGTGDYNTANGIGDGTNALAIANLRHKNTMVESTSSFNDFYISLISKIGSQGEEAKDRVENQEMLLKNLTNLRESVSGINLDEEMSNMVAIQHGYNASARMISTITQMLDTIIRLGA